MYLRTVGDLADCQHQRVSIYHFLLAFFDIYQELCCGLDISEVLGVAEQSLVGSSDLKKPIALPHKTQNGEKRGKGKKGGEKHGTSIP